MLLLDLPLDIVRWIQSYLTQDDYHYFLNSTKRLSKVKFESIQFNLTVERSDKCLKDVNFQLQLVSKVKDWSQIGFVFNYNVLIIRSLPDFEISFSIEACENFFSNVQKITIFASIDNTIPFIPSLKHLTLHGCSKLTNVSNLSHLTTLRLFGASTLTDISPLQNISHLAISSAHNLQDFSFLSSKRQKLLEIISTTTLFTLPFENLRTIHRLHLNSCSLTDNLSVLHGIYDLSIQQCRNILDISGLGGHFRLNLKYSSLQLTGYESLLNVPHVRLTACNISDLSVLRFAKSVELDNCHQALDFSSLINVRVVRIRSESMKDLIGVDQIRGKVKLFTQNETFINFQVVSNMELSLNCISAFLYYEVFQNLKYLTLDFFPGSLKVYLPALQGLQFFRLCYCDDIIDTEGFEHIPNLFFHGCEGLKVISRLGSQRSVRLEYCPSVTDVSSLALVPIVTIIDCEGIEDYECLSAVPRLKIRIPK